MVTSHYVTNLKAALLNGHQVLHYWLSATEELGVPIWGRSYWRVTLFGDNKRNFGTHGSHSFFSLSLGLLQRKRLLHHSPNRATHCVGLIDTRYSTVDRTQGAIIFWLCSMPYDSWCNIILMEPVKNKIVWNRETQINNQKVENMFLYLEEDKLHPTNFGTLLTILISDQYHQRDTFGPLILLYQRHSNFCNNRNWNREKFHQYC